MPASRALVEIGYPAIGGLVDNIALTETTKTYRLVARSVLLQTLNDKDVSFVIRTVEEHIRSKKYSREEKARVHFFLEEWLEHEFREAKDLGKS